MCVECHAAHDKDCVNDSRPQIVNGMPPNLLAHYLYLWELTAVRQAVEPAWISASVRRTFIELLVPAGSSSSLGQARGAEIEPDRLLEFSDPTIDLARPHAYQT